MASFSRQRRRTLAVASVLMLGALALGGCVGSLQQDNVEATAQHGEQVVAEIPGLARAFGEESVSELSETSCTSSLDPDTAPRNTRWRGSVVVSVPTDRDARERAEAVREYAESNDWLTQDRGSSHPGVERLYTATQDELTLTINANARGDNPEISLTVVSPCLEKPAGHTMTRSELDPMYGSSDPLYPNDDRSKFTNGEPKPLPEPSDDSPSPRP
ncbi:hypothetical protein F7P69_12665 [Cellulosimicrobium funkei]|nr:hypothetical protein [Cellulosimicrobium funkei]